MKAENLALFNKIHDLHQLTYILTALVIFCFILLGIATIILCINRKRMKKMHRLYTKRFEHLNQRIETKTEVQTRILANVRQLKNQAGMNNSSQSESHGGNMKGGNQTVNITTEPARDKDYFQRVLLDQVSKTCRKSKEEIKKITQLNAELIEENNRMQQLILRNHSNKTTNAREYPRDKRNRRTQT